MADKERGEGGRGGWRGELTSKGDPILCCSKVYLGEREERLVPRIIMRRQSHPSFASIAKLALSALPAHPRNFCQNGLGVKWNHMARAMTFTTRMTTLTVLRFIAISFEC